MKKKRMIGASAVAIVIAAIATVSWAHRRATAATIEAHSGEIAPRIVARGAIVAEDGVAEVRARVEGRVLRVLVREGDVVEPGQLLAEIGHKAPKHGKERRYRNPSRIGALAVVQGWQDGRRTGGKSQRPRGALPAPRPDCVCARGTILDP